MQSTVRFLLSVLLPGLLGCVATDVVTATDPLRLLANGRLLGPLTVTEQQSGFAGITGTTWTVEADGRYRAVRFVNERVEPPYKQGQLAAAPLRTLGATLERELATLPARLGQEAEINPRTVVIRFAQRTWTLALPPGQSIGEAWQQYSANPADPRYRFLRAVRALLDSIGE